MSAATMPAIARCPPVVHRLGRPSSRLAASNSSAPVRNANGNGMRAGWMGWPLKLALLRISPSASGSPARGADSQRLQIFDQVPLLVGGEPQPPVPVVVVDDRRVGGEPAIVVEAALLTGEETGQRRRAVTAIGRAAGLEVVDP